MGLAGVTLETAMASPGMAGFGRGVGIVAQNADPDGNRQR